MKNTIKISIVVIGLCILIGCGETINLTGVLANRLNVSNNISGSIVIAVKNIKGNMLPNFQIIIIQLFDSVNVFNSKFTSPGSPVTFTFPDEQITQINSDTTMLEVIAYHPQIGLFCRKIIPAEVNDKVLIFEFNAGNISDSLKQVPLHQYLKFKPF